MLQNSKYPCFNASILLRLILLFGVFLNWYHETDQDLFVLLKWCEFNNYVQSTVRIKRWLNDIMLLFINIL